jgi:starvation-inducible DNA-binding protein
MPIEIGLKDKSRDAVGLLLNRMLSDEYVLAAKTRNFHWNVTGPHFRDYHLLFGEQVGTLDGAVDDLAERVRQLGGRSLGSLREFAEHSRLTENLGSAPPAGDMAGLLLHDHEMLIRQLRKDLDLCAGEHGDAGTADFLTGLMESHEKMAWMLRAILEGSAA